MPYCGRQRLDFTPCLVDFLLLLDQHSKLFLQPCICTNRYSGLKVGICPVELQCRDCLCLHKLEGEIALAVLPRDSPCCPIASESNPASLSPEKLSSKIPHRDLCP